MVALVCEINAQCMASMSCLDEDTGIHYSNGQKWQKDLCMDCTCSTSKTLIVSIKFRSLFAANLLYLKLEFFVCRKLVTFGCLHISPKKSK